MQPPVCACVCVRGHMSLSVCELGYVSTAKPPPSSCFLGVMASRRNQGTTPPALVSFLMVCPPRAKIEQCRPGLRLPMKIQ